MSTVYLLQQYIPSTLTNTDSVMTREELESYLTLHQQELLTTYGQLKRSIPSLPSVDQILEVSRLVTMSTPLEFDKVGPMQSIYCLLLFLNISLG